MFEIADEYAKSRGISTHPIHQTFESLKEDLEELPNKYRFVSLGLTFTNYKPNEILKILEEIAGSKGTFFITVQLRDRVDMRKIQKAYKEVIAPKMLPSKLALVGLDFEKDITSIEVTDKVEIYATLRNVSSELERVGVQKGDKLLLLRSYRYTLEQLKKTLSNYNVEYFDEGSQFIGCLIK